MRGVRQVCLVFAVGCFLLAARMMPPPLTEAARRSTPMPLRPAGGASSGGAFREAEGSHSADGTEASIDTMVLAPHDGAPAATPRHAVRAQSRNATSPPLPLLSFGATFPEDLAVRIRRYVEPLLRVDDKESDGLAPAAEAWHGAARTNTSRDLEPSSPPQVEFLVCVREWLYDFLRASIAARRSGSEGTNATSSPPPPRFKMGEVRTWTALLEALSALSCHVVLEKACEGLMEWDHVPPEMHIEANETQRASRTNGVVRLFLTEDLAVDHLRHVNNRPGMCQKRSRQTLAIAGAASKLFPNDRVLPLFHITEHNRSLGLVADCGGLRNGRLVSPRTGQPLISKRWYAVLWGKAKQAGRHVMDAVAAVSRFVPVVSSCIAHCDPSLQTARLSSNNTSTTAGGGDVTRLFGRAVKHAVLMVGVQAPERGAACPEALACGTYVVARGRHLGYEFSGHPLTRRFRKLDQLERYVREILVDTYGFNASLPFDAQPHPPQQLRGWAPLQRSNWRPLPLRYNRRGHTEHIAELFGLDDKCRINPQGLRVSWAEGRVPTVSRSIGASPDIGSALMVVLGAKAQADRWSWSGC